MSNHILRLRALNAKADAVMRARDWYSLDYGLKSPFPDNDVRHSIFVNEYVRLLSSSAIRLNISRYGYTERTPVVTIDQLLVDEVAKRVFPREFYRLQQPH